MVNYLRKKDSPVKIAILKSRKLDFFRINPFGVIKNGFNRLVKKGIIQKRDTQPKDNLNYFVTPAFIVHWAKSRFNDENIHVGITVSKKSTSKRANKRNLIRRRLRYAINQNIRKYNIKGYDFVFTVRYGFLELKYSDLENQINKSLKYIEKKILETK